jgi:hypothetical protein
MKLWNVTSAIAMGALFVFGCSVESTSPTTDGGTTDTGAKTDTGTATTDTGNPCVTCQQTKCATEVDNCKKPENNKGCNDLIMCINACKDEACINACISDSMSTAGKDLFQCVIDKCATECSG